MAAKSSNYSKLSGATQIIFPLALAASLGVLLTLASCKTTDAKESIVLADATATDGDCGPKKTFYFHWASEAAANSWIQREGGPGKSDHSQLQSASSPRYPVTNRLIGSLIEHQTPANELGPGVYLAYGPTETHPYGDTLLIFRISDMKGKGLPCINWINQNIERRREVLEAPGSGSLPLLAQYRRDYVGRWYISPRAPKGSLKGGNEIVEFSLPQVGDAEAYVAELMGSASTLDQFFDAFAQIYVQTPMRPDNDATYSIKDLCQGKKQNGSEIFLQELYCRAVVKKFSKILAQTNKASIPPETQSKLLNFASYYDSGLMNEPEVQAALKGMDSTLACSSGKSPRKLSSPEDIKRLAPCKVLAGAFYLTVEREPQALKALQNLEQVDGSLSIKTSVPFSYQVLAKLEKADSLVIEGQGPFTDCNTVMQLKDVGYLSFGGLQGSTCVPQFPGLTRIERLLIEGGPDGSPATAIIDLKGFSALERIGFFRLVGTSIEDLGFLAKLKSLDDLTLANNPKLRSLQPLLKNNPFHLVHPPFSKASSAFIEKMPQLPKAEIDELKSILEAKKMGFVYIP